MSSHTASDSITSPTGSGHNPTASAPGLVRAAGVAAQAVAGTYVIGFLAMAIYLVPRGFTSPVEDPSASLGFLIDHQTDLAAWYFVLYRLGGVAMAVVALGVAERLRAAPALARVSAALGLIWSGLLMASGSLALIGQHAVVELQAQDPDLALNT